MFSIRILLLTIQPPNHLFCRNELQKKRAYEQRVRDVEMGCFLPLVFSAAGGCGPAVDVVLKRLASHIATRHIITLFVGFAAI